MNTKVTITYGDGIGPEIMESVLSILQEVEAQISFDTIEIGQKIYEKGWKIGITDSAWNTVMRNKILLKAPITTPQGKGVTSLNVTLRKALGLYANVRPCMTYLNDDIDVVIIRENEEDIYSGIEYRSTPNTYNGIKIISHDSSIRICRYAFEYARCNNRKRVSCFVKDNIMKMTDGAFHAAFEEVAQDYHDIKHDSYILDIGAAKLAVRPENFDVIVTTNLYGDIISDIAAELSGSVGLAGSANIGSEYAMFEAVHGSAPDIAGKNLANPSGLLNSAIGMLSYIGQHEAANNIYNAWQATILDGVHTADMYNQAHGSKHKVGTKEFTEAIISNLNKVSDSNTHAIIYPAGSADASIQQAVRTLIGVDLFIEWNSAAIDEIVTRLLSVKSEDLELKNILAKGLIVWPRNEIIKALPSDTICCRFIVRDGSTSHDQINLLLSELCDLEVLTIQKLYLFDNESGFRPL